jgi:hypothetical protein
MKFYQKIDDLVSQRDPLPCSVKLPLFWNDQEARLTRCRADAGKPRFSRKAENGMITRVVENNNPIGRLL